MINVHVSRRGNVYMTEIAEQLADGIRAGGRDAALLFDDLPADDGALHLVVAPHEFFLLHPAASDEAALEAAARGSICINTEQPGTPWFELAARWCAYGARTFDINEHGVEALRARGLEATRLRLGYSQARDVWSGVDADRDVDIVFLGDDSNRRRELLNTSASRLSPLRCELRLFRSDRPVLQDRPGFLAAAERVDLLSRARVLINVHRGLEPYFEWVRVLDAIANGCVVVTEPSEDTAPLEPFVHFVEAPLDSLVQHAIALLDDETKRQQIAHDAYELIRRELDGVTLIDEALRGLAPPPSRPPDRAAAAPRRRVSDASATSSTLIDDDDVVLVVPPDVDLYPNALDRLKRALAGSDAVFAYGLVASREPDGEILGALAWDPERIRESNYVGGLALVRRSHWNAIGGDELSDWDRWRRTADAGKAGAHVRTFVGEQR